MPNTSFQRTVRQAHMAIQFPFRSTFFIFVVAASACSPSSELTGNFSNPTPIPLYRMEVFELDCAAEHVGRYNVALDPAPWEDYVRLRCAENAEEDYLLRLVPRKILQKNFYKELSDGKQYKAWVAVSSQGEMVFKQLIELRDGPNLLYRTDPLPPLSIESRRKKWDSSERNR